MIGSDNKTTTEAEMLSKLERLFHDRVFNLVVAILFTGIYKWWKDQRELVEKGEVKLVGGARYA